MGLTILIYKHCKWENLKGNQDPKLYKEEVVEPSLEPRASAF
jgi:hypothetical protein